ncbi:hypothetical protein ABFX02_12G181500 [Erythranthe guttata]
MYWIESSRVQPRPNIFGGGRGRDGIYTKNWSWGIDLTRKKQATTKNSVDFQSIKNNRIEIERERGRGRGRAIMALIWLEAMLPLGIIAGMLCVMGNAQYFIHKAAHGRPKHIGNDVWDVAMERRDKKIMEMLSSPSPSN